ILKRFFPAGWKRREIECTSKARRIAEVFRFHPRVRDHDEHFDLVTRVVDRLFCQRHGIVEGAELLIGREKKVEEPTPRFPPGLYAPGRRIEGQAVRIAQRQEQECVKEPVFPGDRCQYVPLLTTAVRYV